MDLSAPIHKQENHNYMTMGTQQVTILRTGCKSPCPALNVAAKILILAVTEQVVLFQWADDYYDQDCNYSLCLCVPVLSTIKKKSLHHVPNGQELDNE